ncbi:uncharacterized protein LOC130736097 [Lotus japonicus]|uniref:uncharacterized protein LOC130736097 n=1 Tax=Lotus japonicus TaxID=34305 RepID=UPI0025901FB9|nr:uncharacterized protein LOC130736097 [Lotus japonicus]
MPKLVGIRGSSGSCVSMGLLACKLGNGESIRFLDDVWVGDMMLRVLYPRVYALSLKKNGAVSEMGHRIGGKWEWNFEFRRGFFYWELDQYHEFQCLIQFVLSKEEPDIIFWKGDTMGMFSVKGLCCALEDKWYCEAGWVVSKVIRKLVPAKVTTFMWQLQQSRVATKANLLEKQIILPDGGVCGLCVDGIETTYHLFLHCKEVWATWCSVVQREGLCWVITQTVSNLLLEWGELRIISDWVMWDMIPYALVWTITIW